MITNLMNTNGISIHNKTWLLLSPYIINEIPLYCNTIPIIVKSISSFIIFQLFNSVYS